MYCVESSVWVKVASMHLEGLAARWLQSAERRVKQVGWDAFCAMINERFGHDQHETLSYQLLHIKQVWSVADYVDQFLALVDQLAAYESDANPLYYVMHFVDGLHDDIKSVVMIQHPATLDSACVLALMQEAL
jgi:hypothetical protein